MPEIPLTTAGAPDLVSDVAIRFQAKLQAYKDDNIKLLYGRETWTEGDGRKMTFQTYALPKWGAERSEHESPVSTGLTMGTQIDEDFRAISMVHEVTDYMLQFDRERAAEQISTSLLEGCMREFNLQLTHRRLTYADLVNYQPFGRSYTRSIATPDGVALGGAHTVPALGATTKSNILSNEAPLTIEALTNLIGQCQTNTVDDDGEVVPVNIDTIVIPNYFPIVKRATEILGTPNVPFNMENTINVFNGGKLPNGQSFRLMVLGMGTIARDHKIADGNQNDGTGVTAEDRRYRWGVLDSSMNEALKYSISGTPQVFKAAPTKNGLYSIRANMFVADVATRWQGTGFSFATSL